MLLREKKDLMKSKELANTGKMFACKGKERELLATNCVGAFVDKHYLSIKDSLDRLDSDLVPIYSDFALYIRENKARLKKEVHAHARKFLLEKYKDKEKAGIIPFIEMISSSDYNKGFRIPFYDLYYINVFSDKDTKENTLVLSRIQYSALGEVRSQLNISVQKFTTGFYVLDEGLNDKIKDLIKCAEIAHSQRTGSFKEAIKETQEAIKGMSSEIKKEFNNFIKDQITFSRCFDIEALEDCIIDEQ